MRPEGTEDQSVTYPSVENFIINVHVKISKCMRKFPQRYNPVFGAAGEWNNDSVASIVYMIQYGYFNINVDTDDILSLLDEWYAEDFMDTSPTFHMREYYVLKSQSHYPDTPTYMETLSGENVEEYSKAMDD